MNTVNFNLNTSPSRYQQTFRGAVQISEEAYGIVDRAMDKVGNPGFSTLYGNPTYLTWANKFGKTSKILKFLSENCGIKFKYVPEDVKIIEIEKLFDF